MQLLSASDKLHIYSTTQTNTQEIAINKNTYFLHHQTIQYYIKCNFSKFVKKSLSSFLPSISYIKTINEQRAITY